MAGKDPVCDGGDHVVGFIRSQPIRASAWDAAIDAFGELVSDFNVRGVFDEIPHPGQHQINSFCPACGMKIDPKKTKPLSFLTPEDVLERDEGGTFKRPSTGIGARRRAAD